MDRALQADQLALILHPRGYDGMLDFNLITTTLEHTNVFPM